MQLRSAPVVVDRNLTYRTWNCDWQTSGRIVLAENHLGNGISTLLPGIIGSQKSIGIFSSPLFFERTAFNIYNYKRGAGLLQSFKKLRL